MEGPRPASTVVLLRPSRSRFEVCLVRRHDQVAFMGGAHVFPGGRVDPADRLENPDALSDGVAAAVARMADVAPEDAIAHHVAAVRELFEEAGVLLARRDSQMVGSEEATEGSQFAGYRKRLADGSMTLRAIAEREQLRLALDALVMFAHWLTPDIEIRRYDTRFFVAVAPPGQEAAHDESETTLSVWLDPAEAVEKCLREEIALPPPTWTTLRALERFASAEDVRQWAQRRRVVRVQPRFITEKDRSILTLPGDELYPLLPGFEPVSETRFVLEGGRWRPVLAIGSGLPRS